MTLVNSLVLGKWYLLASDYPSDGQDHDLTTEFTKVGDQYFVDMKACDRGLPVIVKPQPITWSSTVEGAFADGYDSYTILAVNWSTCMIMKSTRGVVAMSKTPRPTFEQAMWLTQMAERAKQMFNNPKTVKLHAIAVGDACYPA